MNKEQFLEQIKNIDGTKLKKLRMKEAIYSSRGEKEKEKQCREFFKNYTVGQIARLWNEAGQDDDNRVRSELMDLNIRIDSRLNKLADYGGLSYGELWHDVYDGDFDDKEWVNLDECFSEFCKPNIDEKDCKHDQGTYKDGDEHLCVLCAEQLGAVCQQCNKEEKENCEHCNGTKICKNESCGIC